MMSLGLALALPRFIIISSKDKNGKNDYMGYINEKGKEEVKDYNGSLAFTETGDVSAYAKFEVEPTDKNGLVHIRSCQNNKYWVRTKETHGDLGWIAATAEKPENDQSKESCTLFKFITVDVATNTSRIVHIQSGCYLVKALRATTNLTHFVSANCKTCDEYEHDIFKIVDWALLVILPKYLAFKGDNGHYLCLRQIEEHPYLQFSTDDIGDLTETFKNIPFCDGTIRMKSTSDSDDNSNGNINDYLLCPVLVDYQTVGLLNLGNNRLYQRLTTEGKMSCFNAAASSVVKEAKLKVEEPILKKNIYDIEYDLENSRVYDETFIILAKNSATNNTQQTDNLDVKLSYTNVMTSNWKTMFSLKLDMKKPMDFGVPFIFKGKIKMSGGVQSVSEWEKTTQMTTLVEVVHKVVVSPMTKVTVFLIATNGKCDVPFTLMQKGTLYNGTIVTTKVQGSYIGSNYYNIDFKIVEKHI